ncbi:MAG: glutamate ligase domain-containing protein, partial [Anaerolineae bacterium]
AMAVAHALGVDREAWSRGIASIEGIPGRMEVIDEGQPHLAVVDFAHTPNALRRALASARELIPPDGKVIAVFGCAGLRDSTKRPMMGRVAGELADEVVVTAEDPRTEDLDAIIGAIAAGVTEAGRTDGRGLHRVPDRFEAVRRANELAGPSDIVLVLGKGHEQSMCFGEVEHPWDDRDALRSALRGESYGDLPTAEARRP